MSSTIRSVGTADELIQAASHPEVAQIKVKTSLAELPTLRLAPGKVLLGTALSRSGSQEARTACS